MEEIARSSTGFVRYDRDVRWVLALVLVAVVPPAASGKPRLREMDFLDDAPPTPCVRAKTWPVAKKCLDKIGTTTVIFATDVAKVVSVVAKHSSTPTVKHVLLYAKVEAGWLRTGFSGSMTPTNELLRVDKLATPNGDGLRLDFGTSVRTSFTLQPSSGIVRGVLRRTFSTVCVPSTWSCRSLMTTCEAYVQGKVYWTFHGEVVWHPTLGARMRGETTAAGGVCNPPKTSLVDEDE